MKQVIGLSAALAVAMVGSYLTWTSEEQETSEGTAIYVASEADLGSITWKSDTQTVKLTRRTDTRGDYFWVESLEIQKEKVAPEVPEAPPEDTPEGEAPPPPPEPVEVEKTVEVAFLGGEQAATLWTAFAPLEALRELPADGSVPLATYGLEEPTATLTVERKGATVELVVGGETYGSKDRYAKVDGKIVLLDDGDLRPLQYATTRLVERNLSPLAEADIASIQVTWEGKQGTFLQKNADDKTRVFWSRDAAPDEADDVVGTWVAKLLKMKLRAYVTESQARDLQPAVSLVVSGNDASWTVEVLRGVDATSGEPKVYARSEYNRSLVELTSSIANGVLDDVGSLFTE